MIATKHMVVANGGAMRSVLLAEIIKLPKMLMQN